MDSESKKRAVKRIITLSQAALGLNRKTKYGDPDKVESLKKEAAEMETRRKRLVKVVRRERVWN